MSDTVDALIIGGGPAGLGSALALCRQTHSVIVFDSGTYRNQPAEAMYMVATWDHHSPENFLAAARAELKARYPDQCTFVDREVVSVARVPIQGTESQVSTAAEVFEVQDADKGIWRGWKVVLATGVRDLLPVLDGIDECWGTGVVHCLFCHGHEQRGADAVAVLALDGFANSATILRVVRACRRFAKKVRIYTHGNTRVASQLQELMSLIPGCDIEAEYIERLEMVTSSPAKEDKEIQIVLENGISNTYGFAVYHPGTEQASPIAEDLGVKLTEDGDIELGAFQETSVPGVFAAGDCASSEKFICVASATGCMAGAGVAQQLQAEARYQTEQVVLRHLKSPSVKRI